MNTSTFKLMIDICRTAMRYGKLQAHWEMEQINNHKTNRPHEMKHTEKIIRKLRSSLLYFHPNETTSVDECIAQCVSESKEKAEAKIEKEFRPTHAVFDSQALINLSSTRIPDDIQLILSFGPKFVFPQIININNIINIITNTSDCFERNLPIETNNEAYKQTGLQLKAYIQRYYSDKERWLLFIQKRLTRFLKEHQDIFILRSDKGKHTVIISKEEYFSKLRALICSSDDYIPIEKLELNTLEDMNNKFVEELFSLKVIDNKNQLWDSCCLVSQMYGLIKIHKSNFPVRPITSACGAPGFKLSSFFAKILSVVFPEPGFHVKNSLMVAQKLQTIKIDDDDTIVSFDVISMFTNITTELMLHIIEKRKNDIHQMFGIPWSLFQKIFLFLLTDCANFSFDNKLYKQRDSLAMGSPLSPILAKILMSEVIDFVLLRYQHLPKFIALYVDDSIWIVKKPHAKFILKILNRFHDRIKFTMEIEKDYEISFLDIKLIRSNNNVITCWYKKPFASLRILNFFSNHSMTCIIETAISFIKMVFRLSHDSFFSKNKEILLRMLHLNSFPEHLIIKLIYENYSLMRPLEFGKNKEIVSYAPIPFFNGFSTHLKERMKSLHPGHSLTSIPDRSTTKHFSYLKDKVNTLDKSNIILLLECECGKYLDIRHTEFRQKASKIISFCNENFDTSQGACITLNHKMNKWNFVRCKNYPIMITKYNALVHFHKNRLQYYTMSNTHYSFKRILDDFKSQSMYNTYK